MAALIAPLPWWPAGAERSERVIGTLRISSGRLVACDPLVMQAAPPAFVRHVPVGVHEVRIGVADGDLAYAVVVLGEEPVSSWEHGRREGEGVHPARRHAPGFDVDATTGAYLDHASAALLLDAQCSGLSLYDRLGAAGYRQRPWATLSLGGGLGLVAFGTGGDGNFASYWGLDAGGGAALLVTDFGVLRERDDETPDSPLAVVIPFPTRRR